MPQSDAGGTPLLGFEEWRALLRSNCGGEVQVSAPNAFAGRMRPLRACGLEAASVKIQWGGANLGCSDHRVERSFRDVRCDGADHYLVVFQVAGQSAIIQIDQAARLTVGDVAFVDTARPVSYLSRFRSTRWLTLRLPRKSVRSHLGFEPLGGASKHRTRISRLLFDLIGDADTESMPSSAEPYMQLAVYDLVGALFAPPNPQPLACHREADRAHRPRDQRWLSRSGFRTGRGSRRSGHFLALRAKASYRARHDLWRIDLLASA
jgi:AraC family transcriptional activator of tynA and feaB